MKKTLALAVVAGVALFAQAGFADTNDTGGRHIKGSKSYQIQHSRTPDAPETAVVSSPADAANIEPAAGAESDAEGQTSADEAKKPLHEQMRLPRKSY